MSVINPNANCVRKISKLSYTQLAKKYFLARDSRSKTKMQDRQALSDVQLLKAQNDFLQAEELIVYYQGAIRSGKTYIGAWASILACLRGDVVLAISPTYQMLQDNVVATLVAICEAYDISYTHLETKKIFKIGKGYLIFRTGENVEAIRGFECTHVWMDESNFFINDKAYLRAIGRMSLGTKDNMKIWLTSSPKGKTWCYKLTAEAPSVRIITQRIEDNYFLSQAFIDNLREQYKGDYALQELDAKVVSFSGTYFDTSLITKVKISDSRVQLTRVCKAFDLGFTANKKSDYSAMAFCGIDMDNNFYILNVTRWKTRIPETKRKIIDLCNETPDVECYIEANGTQVAVYDDLIDAGLNNIIPIKSLSSGKVTRNFPLASSMGGGKVYVVEGEWNDDVIDELDEFDMNDKHPHDDQVDAIAHCYNKLIGGGLTETLRASI